MKSNYFETMDILEKEYEKAWLEADREFCELGYVTNETDSKLSTIEMEMEMLRNAV